MRHYFLTSIAALLVCLSSAQAQAPKPIRLYLSPAKLPSPPLRYQLLPDARFTISGNAASFYKQAADLIDKKLLQQKSDLFSTWSEMPLNQLPLEEMRKELSESE